MTDMTKSEAAHAQAGVMVVGVMSVGELPYSEFVKADMLIHEGRIFRRYANTDGRTKYGLARIKCPSYKGNEDGTVVIETKNKERLGIIPHECKNTECENYKSENPDSVPCYSFPHADELKNVEILEKIE